MKTTKNSISDLEWLDTYWLFFHNGERVGEIFYREMNGFKYKSAKAIITMLRDIQKEARR